MVAIERFSGSGKGAAQRFVELNIVAVDTIILGAITRVTVALDTVGAVIVVVITITSGIVTLVIKTGVTITFDAFTN